jgi:hypothetical protein
MTVKEMIEALSALPPEMPVMANGYDGGYNNVYELTQKDVWDTGPGHSWWCGRYEGTTLYRYKNSPIIKVVVIF